MIDITSDISGATHVNNGGVRAEFYMHTRERMVNGKPAFEDQEYVRIIVAGDSRNIMERKVRDDDKNRWPTQYQAFVANKEQPLDGTPVLSLAGTLFKPSQAKMLHAAGIKTVEDLANISDVNLQTAVKIEGNALRRKAQEWIKQQEGMEPVLALTEENEALKTRQEHQEKQMEEMRAQIKVLSDQLKVKNDA